jgi:RimJ/RimL family protein N-acetyltransferase
VRLPDVELADGPVRLRAWDEGDLPAVAEAAADPYIPTVTTVPRDSAPGALDAWLSDQRARLRAGSAYPFAIAVGRRAAAVGGVSLTYHDASCRDRADLGYWVLARARGRGVATSAARLVARWAFSMRLVHRIELRVEPWNTASLAVARSLGARREGVLRGYLSYDGARHDIVLLSLLPTDAPPR